MLWKKINIGSKTMAILWTNNRFQTIFYTIIFNAIDQILPQTLNTYGIQKLTKNTLVDVDLHTIACLLQKFKKFALNYLKMNSNTTNKS